MIKTVDNPKLVQEIIVKNKEIERLGLLIVELEDKVKIGGSKIEYITKTETIYKIDEATKKELEDKEREIVRLRMALFALKTKLKTTTEPTDTVETYVYLTDVETQTKEIEVPAPVVKIVEIID